MQDFVSSSITSHACDETLMLVVVQSWHMRCCVADSADVCVCMQCACESCAEDIMSRAPPLCPMCRGPIERSIRVRF